ERAGAVCRTDAGVAGERCRRGRVKRYPGKNKGGFPRLCRVMDAVNYCAMSFIFFSGRTFTCTEAGFALKVVGSLVIGWMPLRAFCAGLCLVTILNMPGMVK